MVFIKKASMKLHNQQNELWPKWTNDDTPRSYTSFELLILYCFNLSLHLSYSMLQNCLQMNKWLWLIWSWMYHPEWNICPIAYLFKWSTRRSWLKLNFWHSKGNIGLRVSYKLEPLCMEKRRPRPSLPFCPTVIKALWDAKDFYYYCSF